MNVQHLAAAIKTRRKTLSLDQRSLAEIARISVHCLSDLELGKGNPTLSVVTQVLEALGLELTLSLRAPATHTGNQP